MIKNKNLLDKGKQVTQVLLNLVSGSDVSALTPHNFGGSRIDSSLGDGISLHFGREGGSSYVLG